MTIHHNSLAAYDSINVTAKELPVLEQLAKTIQPMSDREIAVALGWDITSSRPRVTGLRDKGLAYEVCDIAEKGSRTKVRCSAITAAGRKWLEAQRVLA